MSNSESTYSFQTTSWTQVIQAFRLGANSEQSASSLAQLCQRYWYPLYAYLRSSGHQSAVAEDFVQGFFAELLAKNTLQAVDPARGRFRSFLLTACRNYVANTRRDARAQRRGGDRVHLPIDLQTGEHRYVAEPADRWSAERLYDREWALQTIDAALLCLEKIYSDQGRAERFEALRPLIAPAAISPSHAEIAAKLQTTEGAVKVAAHRLRQQFATVLREQVAATVNLDSTAGRKEIDAELNELLVALRG
jgi:RNA polymerase sigma-70 factor (ECF subfamily)